MGDGGRVAAAGEVDPRWRAVQVCPDGETLPGIDVSYWQDTIDWASVATEIDFAFIRVSDGLNHFDTQFGANWEGARSNGVIRGAYQFFRPSLDPIAQADLLLSTMGPLEPGDLPPVIDVETSDGASQAQVIAGIQEWIDRVEGELGVKPIIYTSWGLWSSLTGDTTRFDDYPLWVANWQVSCPSVPDSWGGWDFWQYTDSGSVPGIRGPVDRNEFNGDFEDLLAFAVEGSGGVGPSSASNDDDDPEPDSLSDEDDGVSLEVDLGGLGCASSGAPAGTALGLALLPILLRRRRGPASA